MTDILDEVAAALGALDGRGSFATELTAPSKDLHLSVRGVGRIRFPVSPATARKLCEVARPAPFGQKTKTLLDRRVRDTWEIVAEDVELDARSGSALGAHLVTIGRRLGLPDDGDLEAVPDKLLVYGPGQFFATHQDSERADDMVASLVVVLPSAHRGGAVVVEHRGKKVSLRGAAERTEVALLAFYADCRHQVAAVTSGYRVVLTYHLVYRAATSGAATPSAPGIEALTSRLTAYFATPFARRWSNSPPERPERLVYLLDHEYSQKSLGWERLKGADRTRVAALRSAAERLGCEVFLSLADVHENWSCEEEDWGRGRGRRFGWRDAADDERGADDHQLVDLNDTEIVLTSWIRSDGRGARGMAATADMAEVCVTRSSSEMRPFKSEHEGYMGNYGNTVDRWYRRAALVMWPRDREFSVRAKLSPAWAVKEIGKRIRALKLDDARQAARDLLPFWGASIRTSEPTEAFVRDLVLVATALDDQDLALGLLVPLGPHRITPGVMPALAAADARYALAWSQKLYTAWSGPRRYDTPRWLHTLPRLCAELVAVGSRGAELAAWLHTRETASFEERHKDVVDTPATFAEQTVAAHLDDLLALIEAAAVLGASRARDHLLSLLVAPSTRLPLSASGAFLQKVAADRTTPAIRALGLGALHRDLLALLEGALAAPPRSPDDWSIDTLSKCKCALCVELSSFLRDRRRVRHEWPLAKERRRHVHGQINSYGLPVSHVTLRSGSPHTLVLVKQRALFEREAAERSTWRALVVWLEKRRATFVGTARTAAAPARPRRSR